MAKLAEVHLAEDRVKEIRCEMKDLQEQLALVAFLNDNINVEEVVLSVTSDINALGEQLVQQVKLNLAYKLFF